MALAQVCELQKQYGKAAANLEVLVGGFLWLLAGIPMQEILGAMRSYVLKKNDIPTPAELLNIINPPAPVLSGAAYIGLRKKLADDVYLTPDDRAFIRAYEKQETDKLRGPTEELSRAILEIENYRSQKQIAHEGWE